MDATTSHLIFLHIDWWWLCRNWSIGSPVEYHQWFCMSTFSIDVFANNLSGNWRGSTSQNAILQQLPIFHVLFSVCFVVNDFDYEWCTIKTIRQLKHLNRLNFHLCIIIIISLASECESRHHLLIVKCAESQKFVVSILFHFYIDIFLIPLVGAA